MRRSASGGRHSRRLRTPPPNTFRCTPFTRTTPRSRTWSGAAHRRRESAHLLDLKFFDECVTKSADVLKAALMKAVKFTHVGTGAAEVKEVASNRRVLGPDGKVKFTRTSATKNKEARDAPEGLIDPKLRTLSFWDGETALAALQFYACHPMSYYGDGRVSADFCGLARQKFQDETKVFQVYFNGCGGNVTAGKYNDGSKENRPVLRDRIHAGMVAAWKDTKRDRGEGVRLAFRAGDPPTAQRGIVW